MTAHVQDVLLRSTSGADSFTVGITGTGGAGYLLTLGIEAYAVGDNPISIASITDSAGNTWTYSTEQNEQSPPAAGAYSGSFYGFAAAAYAMETAGVTSVTAVFNEAITDAVYLTVSEYSGVPSGTGTDAAAAAATPGSGTSQATPSVVTSYSNDVIVAQTAEDIGWSSVGSPYTLVAGSDCAWAVVAAPGTGQAVFSGTNQAYYASVILALGGSHTAALTVTPSFSAVRTRGTYRTAALTVTPSFSAARQRGKYRTGSLTVVPSFSAARARGHYRTGALEVIPVFAAVRIRGHYRSAALMVTPSFSAIPSGGAFAPPVFIYPAYWTAAWAQADTRVTVSPAGAQTATVTSAVLGESAATLYPPGPAVIYPSP